MEPGSSSTLRRRRPLVDTDNVDILRDQGVPIHTNDAFADAEPAAAIPQRPPFPLPSPSNNSTVAFSRLYLSVSLLVALLAIVTAPTGIFGTVAKLKSSSFQEVSSIPETTVEGFTSSSSSSNSPFSNRRQSPRKSTTVAIGNTPSTETKKKHKKISLSDSAMLLFRSLQIQEEPKSGEGTLPHWLRFAEPIIQVYQVVVQERVEMQKRSTVKQQRDNDTNTTLPQQIFRLLKSCLDPGLLKPSSRTLTDIIDKVITSTPRLIAVVNLLMSLTFILHSAVSDWFLGGSAARRTQDWGSTTSSRERLGGYLIFKLLLVSAVVGPDTLNFLILLSWYTILSFLQSLGQQCSATTQHTIHSGQVPDRGVVQLLVTILCADCLAGATCVALFHGAGWSIVLLLTCDCVLLSVDVVANILLHLGQLLDVHHAEIVRQLESQVLQRTGDHSSSDAAYNEDEVVQVDHKLERLEQLQSRRSYVLETTVFGLQLFNHILTIAYFCHIWSQYGIHFSMIDGVIVINLHSAVTAASKKIAERRNMYRINRDMDSMFEDASEIELKKAVSAGDVCCICRGTMTLGTTKKVGCGHIYHTTCLRQVIGRARSMEAARCPLCRASIIDGQHRHHMPQEATGTTDSAQALQPAVATNIGTMVNREVGDTQDNTSSINNRRDGEPLFRFSTDNMLPRWIPFPSLSFEIVQRPTLLNDNAIEEAVGAATNGQQPSLLRRILVVAGFVPMTPEEEAHAIENMLDMFPQYDRDDLLRELRRRGSPELVAESILNGSFTGTRVEPILQATEGHELE